ncbi:MAG TPA: filamentous hemagglutinin N-terminal domain-containing protein, partial [Gammaproteobacteria bacterium]|nr:filamentous hemagglutinin N-terminal domain-containing protein [Gammaproteobacteria bacterium]
MRTPLRVVVPFLAALPGAATAQIVLDGTVGPQGALLGPNYAIGDTVGTQVGANLFHSFSEFNIRTGESATFSSAFAGVTDNVIARVTGATASTIDGLLRSDIAGADLWFINPSGLVIGANATLDVQGSFHASTADVLLLQDGGRFDATNVAGSSLTIANPRAFGFLDATIGPISVTGAQLQVAAGETLSLVGGALSLTGTRLAAPNGRIELQAAAGPGNVALRGATPPGTAVTARAGVTLTTA